jgi:hypothetical protein
MALGIMIVFIILIGNAEIDIQKKENRFLNKQYNNCQQEITVLKQQLDSISRTPRQEIYIYP